MKHRLALIGYGGMAGWHHSNIKEKIKGIEVVGAYDVREEANDKARENGLKVYASVAELLADKDIDIVTIATPNDFHRGLAIEALRAGKHVVCEKPVTLNAKELEDIIAVAKETGKLFSIHQNRRWDRDFLIVKKAIDEGIIGTPYFVESRVQGSRGAMHGWRGHKQNGGGMLLDWGVHLIDQAMQMFPEKVVSVDAHLFSLYGSEVDDNIKLLLRFESGVSVLLEMATNCFINQPRWHVSGTGGTLIVEDWSCKGRIVKLKEDGAMTWADDIVYTEAGPTRTMAPRPKHTTQEVPLPEVKADWTEYYQNIVDVLNGKAELIVKPEQALRVMNVIDALFASQESGTGLKVNI
ncbi:MAG: Gfo/Idh/MocA family oxidoreductase [Clostridiales bacterium]|jgi:predicted dehydrogenase|nr:Gfo/Idh/MocA family oxidoreductase [Clostridiales bacterium]